jgi:hypothetical protein
MTKMGSKKDTPKGYKIRPTMDAMGISALEENNWGMPRNP